MMWVFCEGKRVESEKTEKEESKKGENE